MTTEAERRELAVLHAIEHACPACKAPPDTPCGPRPCPSRVAAAYRGYLPGDVAKRRTKKRHWKKRSVRELPSGFETNRRRH